MEVILDNKKITPIKRIQLNKNVNHSLSSNATYDRGNDFRNNSQLKNCKRKTKEEKLFFQ